MKSWRIQWDYTHTGTATLITSYCTIVSYDSRSDSRICLQYCLSLTSLKHILYKQKHSLRISFCHFRWQNKPTKLNPHKFFDPTKICTLTVDVSGTLSWEMQQHYHTLCPCVGDRRWTDWPASLCGWPVLVPGQTPGHPPVRSARR